jgi:SAM-dependent methyltransferase
VGRWFAWYWEGASRRTEKTELGLRRAQLVRGARGRVLEIGIGNGLSLGYYGGIERLTAIEPDPHMARRLKPRLERAPFPVDFLPISGEALPFSASSFDTVVVSLVLCSVANPSQTLAEAHRVLAPDGQLRFLEHVRGDGVGGQARDLLSPLWQCCGGGCRPNRDSEAAIQAAGFRFAAIERYRIGFLPYIQGVAVK